jgi:hypothetical protein
MSALPQAMVEVMAADAIEAAMHEFEDEAYREISRDTTRVERGEYLLELSKAIRNEMESIKEEAGP